MAVFAAMLTLGLATSASSSAAQEAVQQSAAQRSTRDGVYTFQQAQQGRDVFAGLCQSCHTATAFGEAPFRNKWGGRTLGALYEYVSVEMPKTDPGVLTPDEYLAVMAYILKLNGMPTGSRPLANDPAALSAIRFDTLPAANGAGATRLRR